MNLVYPALFYYVDSEPIHYLVYFPDLKGAGTQGEDIPDALVMACDWLGMTLSEFIENGKGLPSPSPISDLSLNETNPFGIQQDSQFTYDPHQSFISMVLIDLDQYLQDQASIQENVLIPKWAVKAAERMELSYSSVLTKAIAERAFTRNHD